MSVYFKGRNMSEKEYLEARKRDQEEYLKILNSKPGNPVIPSNDTDEVKTDEVKTNEADTNEVKTDEVGTNEVKTDEVGTNEVKTDEVGTNEVKTDEVGTNEVEYTSDQIYDMRKDELIELASKLEIDSEGYKEELQKRIINHLGLAV